MEEIQEKNKLIAEFMGVIDVLKMFGYNDGFAYRFDKPIGSALDYDEYGDVFLSKEEDTWEVDSMEFHSSWDWIMPVVEKIESLGFRFKIAFNELELYDIEDHRFSTACNIPNYDCIQDKGLNKLTVVVQSCV